MKKNAPKQGNDLVFNQHFNVLPMRSILVGIIVAFLLIAFFTGATCTFYASFLFLFYSWIGKMWISVMMLGVFQTILMIPFRAINLHLSVNIKSFREEIEKVGKKSGRFQIKKAFETGDFRLLWYLINFSVQIVSYLSIGRLFLTDFYTTRLNPKLLYDFVSYPNYPIKDTFFKLPYPVFTQTIDHGMDIVWTIWIVAIIYKLIVSRFIKYAKKRISSTPQDKQTEFVMKILKFTSGSVILIMILAWFLVRSFPVGWEIRIFSGDITIPNRTLNTITAIMTFILIMWHGVPRILAKKRIAKQLNLSPIAIKKSQTKQFRQTFQNASILGIGAFVITNLIPSAFELSIFTLEVISMLSPLTLDRMILRPNIGAKPKS